MGGQGTSDGDSQQIKSQEKTERKGKSYLLLYLQAHQTAEVEA